jgi:uncharacterized protein (TIGR02598 family)
MYIHRMHALLPPDMPSPRLNRRRKAGFSLVEVAMAIGIIAVAFVALFALLPVGLNGFRASMDTANETWIMQGINSMIQTTPWEKIWDASSSKSEIAKDEYYFDEEGRLLETKLKPAITDAEKAALARIYEVKLVVDPAYRHNVAGKELLTTTAGGGSGGGAERAIAVRVVAIIAKVSNPQAVKAFDSITTLDDVNNLESTSPLSVRSFVATQMNSAAK